MMQLHLTRNSFRKFAAVIFSVLALAIVSQAQDQAQDLASQNNITIKIKNFGRMDERFYRGGQPKKEDYKDLAALGIQTVIDLRDDPADYERPLVESLGMKYVNLPMLAKKYPTEEVTSMFLKLVSDPATGKFFVHCAGGRHRTGAMGAVYRFKFDNWDFDQAYAEMKRYDFYTSWGHGAFKDFVRDYYKHLQAAKAPPLVSPLQTGISIQEK